MRTVFFSLLLAPFLIVGVFVMLVAALCDFSLFRLKANLGEPLPPKGLWEF